MKLTKKLESEIKQVMDTYWDSYLKGDLKQWASFLHREYKNIGTTREEIWNNKKEITDYSNKVAHQLKGMAELRQKKTQLIVYDPYIMVHEFGDMYIKPGESWVFYAKLRLSSLLEKTSSGWKILHQHGSYPDSKTEEGETFAFTQITKENLELKEAVKRRTAELENKTRELEIEASLERVRTVAMGMKTPNDLMGICKQLYTELRLLGFDECRNTMIHTFFDDRNYFLNYDYSDATGESLSSIPYSGNQLIEKFIKDIRKEKDSFSEIVISGKELKDWKAFRIANKEYDDPRLNHIKSLHYYNYSVGESGIGISTYRAITAEKLYVLERFKNTFDLAYKKYVDIKTAEAMARESQIEAALERVRSRTMAMQRSEELQESAAVMFQQIAALDVNLMGCGFNIWDEDRKAATAWMSGMDRLQPPFKTDSSKDIFQRIYNAEQRGETIFMEEQSGKELIAHYKYMASIPTFRKILDDAESKGLSAPSFQIMHCTFFSQGYLMFITYKHCQESYDIFIRFARLFEQTYTRFLDLQKVEEQARNARIELALERVRARSMAMRNSEELADLSLELVKQVQILGVATWFCAFNIYDDNQQYSTEWGSNGEGVFNRYRTPREGIFLRYYEAGQRGETLLINEIGENECPAHYEYLCSLPGVGDQLLIMKKKGLPFPASQIDHVAYFRYGYILFITYEPAPGAHDIFIRFAKVFEQTYTRFLDLQKAEAQALQAEEDLLKLQTEKKRAEDALSELQITQKQLIQAEKMASLGELTAGIAHEIQNPLNFVNNFSEVSNELLDEMMEEAEKGNYGEVKELLKDVKQNLEKINHHGKRADGIVKGMLLHSRSSSGQKEPTDINALADEYLRLAYHGLRAKDKSFNATLKTDYDNSIGKISIIPQDIGRVILNLITNAFYVVGEKKKENITGYHPTVSVSTKKEGDHVFITITDNGNGIPPKILDKIFQPFFTTKPTGQGTGLGLSLSYDIVKAHGGELRVETKEGEGSEFIIQLNTL
ncbi:ATP-binding protein [Flavihumibacter stibioxidans]|uniref:histidine kinase n=1 Tax=Flavihumibacter stibioxidans TaxID=1834163 RepID=A0ABR7M941_9BACT|nr:ATP-binding protein [Flavihumibacter stibioxidans]MBC6491533.1 hypothetical protein [Flavihumibacter stibioxidans]